jgi:hypothetical protein
MNARVKMKCSNCGHWNRVPVNKAFFEPDNQLEPKVKWTIPMYQPVQITKCEKCGRIIAEPNVLIRVIDGKVEYWREK